MLEKIIAPENLNSAYVKVIQNKGTHGSDGMTTQELLPFLELHGEELRHSILNGTYSPQPVRQVNIPKGNGQVRTLGIPTALDRLVQRAVVQVLMPIYEAKFAETSYGFRPSRSVEDAVKMCVNYFENNYVWTVDMDLEKFFDTVNRKKLMAVLARDIHDKRVLDLISKFINSGAVRNKHHVNTSAGIPQGGPLSPLLANVMLNELDKELISRHENFVRYADDMLIFCRSRASANQALKHITPFIQENLYLRINHEKTIITHAEKLKFLGYGFFESSGKFYIKIHEDSAVKFRERITELAYHVDEPDGMRKFQQYITAWISHYRLADIEKFLRENCVGIGRSLQNTFAKIWLNQQQNL